jgi:subtilisin family serine protease
MTRHGAFRTRALRAAGTVAGAMLAAGLLPAALTPTAASAAPPAPAADSGTPGATATAATRAVSSPTGRWIVQLAEPALARHPQARTRGKLDPTGKAATAYTSRLAEHQRGFADRLRQVAPKASVLRTYKVALDGMSVRMSPGEAVAVRTMPGVLAVTPDIPYQLDMFSTPAQIGAPALWSKVGGQSNAGAGVKVAIIDSGIFVRKNADGSYAGNPCFDDAGYPAMPAGYPKGDARFTNRKVLVARAYVRPDDPPIAGEAQAIQGTNTSSPHGTHVAGTVACDAGTHITVQGADVTLSGVAPKAYLLNYRVFYPSQSSEDFQRANAYVTELVAAIDDAVADGADVVSSSWGSSYQNTLAWPDPMVQAAEAATDAGVTMVFAQGNAGPDGATGNLPAASPKVIAVGAITKTATITPGDLAVTGPAPVPANLTGLAVGGAQFGPPLPASIGPAKFVGAGTVASNGSTLGCSLPNDISPFPAGSLAGQVAVIERGVCNFSEKVFNAQRGGAVAALVYNNAANGDALQAMGNGVHGADVTIPSLFLRRSDGQALTAFAAAHPGTAELGFTLGAHPAPNPGDVMAAFSSRGPTADKTLKPDVVAPGVDVWSAGYGSGAYPGPFTGFGAVSGTSMATPHVAGSVALLKQLHPQWTPAQLKSALMSTASTAVYLDTNHTVPADVLDRGAGKVDLSKAGDPGLTLAPASLSGGEIRAGTSVPFTVAATDAGIGGLWDVTTKLSANAAGNVTITPATNSIIVRRGGSVSFPLTVTALPGAAPASYSGEVTLSQRGVSRVLHLPLWLRVVPSQITKQVLLVDDDGSVAGLSDHAATYRGVLDRLGISYDYLDVGTAAFPDLNTLFGYRTVVVFTGDNASFATSGFALADHDRLSEWLDSGGRLLAIGQNTAEASDDNTGFSSARLGRARLYHGYLGVAQESADLYGDAAPPSPTAAGEGVFAGVRLSLDGSQGSVEGTSPIGNTDTFSAAATMTRFFAPLGSTALPGWGVGFGRSSEPSLAEARQQFRYRSAVLGFGLEGVADQATRDALAARLLSWLRDDLSITQVGASVSGRTVSLTASAASPEAAVTGYRWDFGDGSAIASTAAPSTSHRYARAGTYTVRVEVTDALGHRALQSRSVRVR